MAKLYKFWDLGEDLAGRRVPNFGKTSTARVMQALLILGGRLYDSMVEGSPTESDRNRIVAYRIALPIGSREDFQKLTGYRLTRSDNIGVN